MGFEISRPELAVNELQQSAARVGALVLLLALACGSDEHAPPDIEASEIQLLHTLGYVDDTDETVDPSAQVVDLYDETRSLPGFNLATTNATGQVHLFDMRGRVLREWSLEGSGAWSNAEFARNGDLLAVASEGRLLRFTWDGRLRWQREGGFHHDVEEQPDGRLFALANQLRELPGWKTPILDGLIVELTASGETLASHSLYDLFAADFERLPLRRPAEHRGSIDLFHANSIEVMPNGHVLVSMRHQNAAAAFDLESGHIAWSWGRGRVQWPHDATLLEGGHLLFFDNGVTRKWSRVIEVDVAADKIVWQYRAPRREDFYTAARGSNQRLSNGNTLIADSNSGQAFEVARNGDIVWRWKNPLSNPQGKRRAIVRIRRYDVPIVEEWQAQ